MSKLYVCIICNKKKQPNEFYIHKSGDKKGKISNYTCKLCHKNIRDSQPEDIKQARLEYIRNYHKDNHNIIKEKRLDYFKEYYVKNKDKQAEYHKKWRSENLGLHAAKESRRRSKKLQRTPSWTTKEEESKIKSLYKMCRSISKKTGILHVVDHIIPLQGTLVSGLHTITNLRIITQTENCKKYNKLIEDMIYS